MIFLAIDIVYLSFWTGKYPYRGELIILDVRPRRAYETASCVLIIPYVQDSDQDIVLQYKVCYCDNFGILIGVLFIYKGAVVICGLFLAYESRNVKYFYINDSRFVSITMYIVVILVGIGAPLSLVLAVHYFIDAAYALAVFTIIAACMSSLFFLYIPKVWYCA